ncbi:hypothetical protein MSG28_011324 [Choristoneura fumiferana]|uniref:Uncharacterized protein n=1 Tax=Choristoneura fumiferana TaxID=7141 RepID=A0ACC0KRR7_CHOFU|nr:hypothetical protein MSG28_011324 [Choristoneura fumiferana]
MTQPPSRESWNGELLGYAVTWRALSGGGQEDADGGEDPRRAGAAAAAGGDRTALRLRGLRRGALYAVTLRAFNRAGAGPPAPRATGATAAPGVPAEAPGGVRCAAEAGALRVWWAPPPGPAPPAHGYDVHYAPLYDTPGAPAAARAIAARSAAPADALPVAAWRGPAGGGVAAAAGGGGGGGGAAARAARRHQLLSVGARARRRRPRAPSAPALCTTLDDGTLPACIRTQIALDPDPTQFLTKKKFHAVPGAVSQLRALPAGAGAARVAWRAPAAQPRPTHYTLYTKERDKAGGEWAQRVAAGGAEAEDEAWHDVRGLRERVVYEFWVRAHSAAGAGPPGRVAAAAPSRDGECAIISVNGLVVLVRQASLYSIGARVSAAPVRISSWAREVRAARGTQLRLGCAAAGRRARARARARCGPAAAPTRARRHRGPAHTRSGRGGGGQLHVRGVGGGRVQRRGHVGRPAARPAPAPPAPRLRSAAPHQLLLAWGAPPGSRTTTLCWVNESTDEIYLPIGFTVWWSRDDDAAPASPRSLRVPAGAGARGGRGGGAGGGLLGAAGGAAVRRAAPRVAARALGGGRGPPSRALLAATTGRREYCLHAPRPFEDTTHYSKIISSSGFILNLLKRLMSLEV